VCYERGVRAKPLVRRAVGYRVLGIFNPLQSKGIKYPIEKGATMALSEEDKKKLLEQRAKEWFDNYDNETISIRDEITDIVENTIGKCSASETIVQNVLLKIEHHYGEIES